MTEKRYDRAYFDKWYRSRQHRVNSKSEVRRKVWLAVSVAEYFLRRPIRSVLDVGCGEAAWREHLLELRPRASYLGLDASEYVVGRFGTARNIRKASFGELPSLGLKAVDLVVCADVLHYIPDAELRAGVEEIATLTDGLAYLEVLTAEDDIVGDLHGLLRRPAAWYRKVFRAEGLLSVGPYCWLSPMLADQPAELERVRS